jgi:hypothetical protein
MSHSHELSAPSVHTTEIELRHQSIQIPTDRPLMTLEESQKHHINAAVLAELTLPTPNSKGEPKKLHLLDFGEDIPEQGKAVYYLPDIGDTSHIAVSKTRFALKPVNYTPDTHLVGLCELPVGRTTIGRERTDHAGYWLGLSDCIGPSAHNDANSALSRQHFTIEVTEQGSLTLEDHSTNGTEVKLAQ